MQQKPSRQKMCAETNKNCLLSYLHEENEIFVIARHVTTITTTKLDIFKWEIVVHV